MTEPPFNFIKRVSVNNRRFIQVNFTLGYPLFILLISLPYLLWEAYWIYKVGYAAIKWHTHLLVYFYLWLAGYLILYYSVPAKNRSFFIKGITICTAMFGSLLLAESFLLFFKIGETTVESIGGGYSSWYDASHESWYHIWAPDKPHWLEKREYRYIRHANSLGFSDIEWPAKKKKSEKRFLALGDSFTEGDGAPYDSSYVAQLRETLTAADSNNYIMNAGTCGCDPFINFVNYRDRLLSYHPDMILQTLSSGDMNVDIITRGGMERFKPAGEVQFRKSPAWEPVYVLSNISRLMFSAMGYDQLLMKKSYVPENKKYLDSIVTGLFIQYAALAKNNHCKLVIVLQPFRGEVDRKKYDYDFSVILNALKNNDNIQVDDLMPFYVSYIKDYHQSSSHYYWPIDGHHNSAGYTMMAQGVKAAIDSSGRQH